MKSESADVKDKEMGNSNEDGSEESLQDKKSIIKEGAGGEEIQDVEGSNVKGKNKLEKAFVGDKTINQSSSKKPVHSFFGNHINYLTTHSITCFSPSYQACRYSASTLNLCAGGIEFEYWLGYWLSSVRCLIVLPSFFRQMPG